MAIVVVVVVATMHALAPTTCACYQPLSYHSHLPRSHRPLAPISLQTPLLHTRSAIACLSGHRPCGRTIGAIATIIVVAIVVAIANIKTAIIAKAVRWVLWNLTLESGFGALIWSLNLASEFGVLFGDLKSPSEFEV